MDIAVWVVSGVLALVFLGAGAAKLTQPRQKLIESNMGWAEDFSDQAVKLIGAVEVLGAVGLVLPWALDIAPILTPLAATGLALVMIGAAVTHLRRKETPLPPLVLGALAAFVAVARFAG